MSQEITISSNNYSEVYMEPTIECFKYPSFDVGLFIDTPLIINVLEEEVEHDDSNNFGISTVYFDDSFYILKESLNSDLNFDGENWFVHNEYLDINVWGNSREQVIEAFNFTFHSIYQNFGKEEDLNLSEQGIELKNKVLGLILFSNEG